MTKIPRKSKTEPILTLFLLLSVFALIAWQLEQHQKRWDVTMAREYTLSPETLRLLQHLDKPLDIMAFFQPDQAGRDRAEYILDTYAYASERIRYRFVDPDREPDLAQKHGVKGYGQLVLIYEGREERIGFFTEQDITNALAKLIQSKVRVAYFLTGHGERNTEEFDSEGYSRLKQAMEEQNFRIASLNLMTAERIPDDAAVVVVAGPRKNLFPEEIAILDEYLEGAGSLLVMLDPNADGGLRTFLSTKNILIQDDLIIDKKSRVLGGDYLMPVISRYADHEITKNSTMATIMYEARSVRAKKDGAWISTELAWTADESWAETDVKSAQEQKLAVLDESDMMGPVSVAATGLKILRETRRPGGGLGADAQSLQMAAARGKALVQCRIVVIGDSDFAKNSLFDLSGNSELALNAINFLARSPDMISIRPRSRDTIPLILTQTQSKWLFWFSFAFMPGLILLGGAAAWVWKKRHT
jgi:ABC-type uncharacterized transport system involved in gliding motility auxiliary subunit